MRHAAGMDEPPRSVLARGLSVLTAFADSATPSPELTLADLVAHTGLPSATVHRLVSELVTWGAYLALATVAAAGLGEALGPLSFGWPFIGALAVAAAGTPQPRPELPRRR